MPEIAPVDIPDRALFKAAEVCELLKLQPYVLRSWEAEFPMLGVAKGVGVPRVYRRADVEQVLRIRHLLLVDGLTLAGARRRLEEEAPAVLEEAAVGGDPLGPHARERLGEVKRGLRSLLDLLNKERRESSVEFSLAPPAETPAPTSRRRAAASTPKPVRGRSVETKPALSPGRKRSA